MLIIDNNNLIIIKVYLNITSELSLNYIFGLGVEWTNPDIFENYVSGYE